MKVNLLANSELKSNKNTSVLTNNPVTNVSIFNNYALMQAGNIEKTYTVTNSPEKQNFAGWIPSKYAPPVVGNSKQKRKVCRLLVFVCY